MEVVKLVMTSLSAKEAAIIRLRFGLHEDIKPEDYYVSKLEEQQIVAGHAFI